MAPKKKDAPRPAATSAAPAPATPPARRRLDARIVIYGVLDVLFAALYVYLLVAVAPNRHAWAQALLLAIPLCAFVMGAGTVAGGLLRTRPLARVGWTAAVIAGAIMLVVTVAVLALLLASAAFLSGVYGSFGRAAAGGILGAAALIVELVGILPVLQLKFLMTRAGRRAFGLPPLGAR